MTEQQAALSPAPKHQDVGQIVVGIAMTLVAVVMAWATWQMAEPAHATPGAGARLVPTLCAVALGLCGGWLVWEARSGGWRNMAATASVHSLRLGPWVWVSAGMLCMGMLITHWGFVWACSIGYVLVVQGLRRTAVPTQPLGWRQVVKDALWGLLMAVIVLALFRHVLGVQLPVLTNAGWL